MRKTTIKKQILSVMPDGEKPEDLICFYQNTRGEHWEDEEEQYPIIRCSFDELPEFEYDAGFGGTNGPPLIAFSERYVYIHEKYDGAEDVVLVPRHPEYVTWLPWIGG